MKVRERYLNGLRAELRTCEELEYLSRRGARQQGDLAEATASDIYPELVRAHAKKRMIASADKLASMAIARAGLARSYEHNFEAGSLHLFLGRLSAERGKPASAFGHLELAIASFRAAGNEDGLSAAVASLSEVQSWHEDISPSLEALESSMQGKYRRHLSTSIQTIACMGHLKLSHDLAAEAIRRKLLPDGLITCLLGGLLSCSQGDYDSASDWLEMAEELVADPAQIKSARGALENGILHYVSAVEELGISWLAAGIDAATLRAALNAVEEQNSHDALMVLKDPAVYFMPTIYPQLLELAASTTTDSGCRARQYKDAHASWIDVENRTRVALSQISRAAVERSAGRYATAAASGVWGVLELEELRRRNRLGSTRRSVLASMIDVVHESILDIENRTGSDPHGFSLPSPQQYATILDAVRQDALALLFRQRGSLGENTVSRQLADLADAEFHTLPSLTHQNRQKSPLNSAAHRAAREGLIRDLELRDIRALKVIFPEVPSVPERQAFHQIIVDCAPRPDGRLGLFGVWIAPLDAPLPEGSTGYSVFWDSLGVHATRFLAECKDPTMRTRPGEAVPIPGTLTDAADTGMAMSEIASVLPEGFLEAVACEREPEVVIVPTGPLWGVPWAALPVGRRMLLDYACTRLAPSTGLATTDQASAPTMPNAVTASVDPELLELTDNRAVSELRYLITDRRSLNDLRTRSHQLVTLVLNHGSPQAGLSHHVYCGDERYSAEDVLVGAQIGGVLILLACYAGACRYDRAIEPIAFPTVALVKGARAVIAPVWAIPAEVLGVLAVDLLKQSNLQEFPAQALRQVQLAARSRDPDPSTWATIACFG